MAASFRKSVGFQLVIAVAFSLLRGVAWLAFLLARFAAGVIAAAGLAGTPISAGLYIATGDHGQATFTLIFAALFIGGLVVVVLLAGLGRALRDGLFRLQERVALGSHAPPALVDEYFRRGAPADAAFCASTPGGNEND